MKVIFFDRDGIINTERGDYTWLESHFMFTTNLIPFLKRMQKEGYSFIIITNQGGIDKGLYQKKDTESLHKWMLGKLAESGIEFLDVFYCPHHSDIQKCLCRKPGSQMIEKAIAVHKVDKSQSFMIGDRQRDVDAARGAGIRGILFDSNPDWETVNLETLLT